jgi:hypothetical protein
MGEKLTGVDPKIIQWTREKARYSLESVAVKLKKDVSRNGSQKGLICFKSSQRYCPQVVRN